MFDAVRYNKTLEKAGFSKEQSMAAIQVGLELMNEKFSTKQDLQLVEVALRADIDKFRAEMKETVLRLRAEMKEMEIRLRVEMKELENRVLVKVGVLMGIQTTITLAVLKYLLS